MHGVLVTERCGHHARPRDTLLPAMFSVNIVLRTRTQKGWVRIPVRKTAKGKFIWDNPAAGIYYLEWYEDGKRKRHSAGVHPAEILEARRRKILELKGKAAENGRAVPPGTNEERPVPLAPTIDAYLNHLRLDQKLNTFRRYRSVLGNFRDHFAASVTSMKSPAATFSSTGIFAPPAFHPPSLSTAKSQ